MWRDSDMSVSRGSLSPDGNQYFDDVSAHEIFQLWTRGLESICRHPGGQGPVRRHPVFACVDGRGHALARQDDRAQRPTRLQWPLAEEECLPVDLPLVAAMPERGTP